MNTRAPAKVLFIHNAPMWYRLPFFGKINKTYNVKFVFNHVDIIKNEYWLDDKVKEDLKDLNYIIIDRDNIYLYNWVKLLFYEDCDIMVDSFIYTDSIFTFFLGKLRNKKLIFWSEDWGWPRPKTTKRRIAEILENFIIRNLDALLVPGTRHRDYFVSRGASPNKVFIMPNASNITYSSNDSIESIKLRNNLNLYNKRVILYVGRLIERKGVQYLIEAMHRLRTLENDFVLLIVGQGEFKESLEMLSHKLNLDNNVYFLGYVDDKFLAAYYLLADVCVVPSICYQMGDPWVFVVNEAMFFGKPVIATSAVGSAFDMLQNNKTGFIIPERDTNAIFLSISELLSNNLLRDQIGLNAEKFVKSKYTYEEMIAGFKRSINYVTSPIKKI